MSVIISSIFFRVRLVGAHALLLCNFIARWLSKEKKKYIFKKKEELKTQLVSKLEDLFISFSIHQGCDLLKGHLEFLPTANALSYLTYDTKERFVECQGMSGLTKGMPVVPLSAPPIGGSTLPSEALPTANALPHLRYETREGFVECQGMSGLSKEMPVVPLSALPIGGATLPLEALPTANALPHLRNETRGRI